MYLGDSNLEEIEYTLSFDCDENIQSDDLNTFSYGLAALAGAAALALLSSAAYAKNVYPKPDPDNEVIDAFDPATVPALKEELAGKKLALALVTDYDELNNGGVISGIAETFPVDFQDMPNHVLKIGYTENLGDVLNYIRDYSSVQKIDSLILVYHGNDSLMQINNIEYLNPEAIKDIFSGYDDCFTDSARLLLYSCETGDGKGLLVHAFANTLDMETMAPKKIVVSENLVKDVARKGEFAYDDSGRVSFDTDKFGLINYTPPKGGETRVLMGPRTLEIYSNFVKHPDSPDDGIDLFLLVTPKGNP